MPDVPWTGRAELEPGRTYVVMASHLPLRRLSATVTFFLKATAVRRQLAETEGLVGYTLRAKPLSRDYWTLSVWTDASALEAFMRAPPHVGVMSSLKPIMLPTKFVRWEITADDGRPTWDEALERLQMPAST